LTGTTEVSTFRLLSRFEKLFSGTAYKHRISNQGDLVAIELYEDLLVARRSTKYVEAIESGVLVRNTTNRLHGIRSRRGDGTLGEIVAGEAPIRDPGYGVARGKIATVEIGVEVKILAKAMIKQIDRVENDLRNQVLEFKKGGSNPVTVGIVGINHADRYVSFEGDRIWPTTGRSGHLHPSQEAEEAEARLTAHVAASFTEFLLLRYKATNEDPFPFSWVDWEQTRLDYAAALTRISRLFQQRV
jgi:hypothetical protein